LTGGLGERNERATESPFLHNLVFFPGRYQSVCTNTTDSRFRRSRHHTESNTDFELATLNRKVLDHGVPAQFEGVSLDSLLSSTGVQLGDKLRGPRMTEELLVEAADGYRVAFALAEVDLAFSARDIILADKRDRKPLDAKEGPLRIVAPGDKRPARWVRQVTALRLIAVR
jgi:hypothetical protein